MAARISDGEGQAVYVLDMGREQYGDCLLCQVAGRTLLIDAGRPGDIDDRDGFPSIPHQLQDVLGEPPFDIDLLVITHAHRDHIGCLPAMVDQGLLKVKWALVSDEKLGFGRTQGESAPDSPSQTDKLAAALREEDYSHLSDDLLNAFIQDAATLEQKYIDMIAAMTRARTKVVRFGRDKTDALEKAFAETGLKILGPSTDQVLVCAKAIASYSKRAPDFLSDAAGDLTDAYRRAVAASDAGEPGAEDRPGKGAAVNDQSVVLMIGQPGAQVLLTGDQQFAAPEIRGIQPFVTRLRDAVKAAGPYQFIKLAHHGSYNGLDESVLAEWADTHRLASSGGSDDASHPEPGVLRLLSGVDGLKYARTDRNGRLGVNFSDQGAEFSIQRGEINDFTPNGDISTKESTTLAKGPVMAAMRPAHTEPVVRLERKQGEFAELSATARIPSDVNRVVVSFDLRRNGSPANYDRNELEEVEPTPLQGPAPVRSKSWANGSKLGGGRPLPRLLFVSHGELLAERIGRQETDGIFGLVREAGQELYLLQDPANAMVEVREQLQRHKFKGVVILGNYDVVPSRRLDTLPPSLRQQVGVQTNDADNFIVWSDEPYGDMDGNGSWDMPVSRIPDGKSPKLMLKALCAGSVARSANTRFGIRNVARPFAEGPFEQLSGAAPLLVSQPTTPANIGASNARASRVYMMLHGSHLDATRFWGEDGYGDMVVAVDRSNVPTSLAGGVVFTGCCWGALPVSVRAKDWRPGLRLGGRTPGTSIALGFLEAGVNAFVGCTGSHYSPTVEPYKYFGGPMHEAFWKHYLAGKSAARALFDAKADYLAGIPHGQTGATAHAIEFKILRQTCCIGIGWEPEQARVTQRART
jgi:beta-lactamase superfamily II metal-dependent hydrolase